MNLAYVVRATNNEYYDAPIELMNETCCTEDTGSLEEELIKRASHSHPLFKEDNAAIFCTLEESTRYTAHVNRNSRLMR